jgi:hypothetical protein
MKSRTHRLVVSLTFDRPVAAREARAPAADSIHGTF